MIWRKALLKLGAAAKLQQLARLEGNPTATIIFSRALLFIVFVIVLFMAAFIVVFIGAFIMLLAVVGDQLVGPMGGMVLVMCFLVVCFSAYLLEVYRKKYQ